MKQARVIEKRIAEDRSAREEGVPAFKSASRVTLKKSGEYVDGPEKQMKKRWLIGIVSFPVFLLVGFGVPHAIKSLNRDKLIVLNSNLAKLSEADLASRIPLEPAPRTLLLGEIERIRDLLDPGNRHLVKNAQGQYFSLELQFRPPEGKKLLVATAGNAEKAKE